MWLGTRLGVFVIFIVMMILIVIVIETCLNVLLNFQTSKQLVLYYRLFLLNQTFGLDFWITGAGAGAGIQLSV